VWDVRFAWICGFAGSHDRRVSQGNIGNIFGDVLGVVGGVAGGVVGSIVPGAGTAIGAALGSALGKVGGDALGGGGGGDAGPPPVPSADPNADAARLLTAKSVAYDALTQRAATLQQQINAQNAKAKADAAAAAARSKAAVQKGRDYISAARDTPAGIGRRFGVAANVLIGLNPQFPKLGMGTAVARAGTLVHLPPAFQDFGAQSGATGSLTVASPAQTATAAAQTQAVQTSTRKTIAITAGGISAAASIAGLLWKVMKS
jgi:hypothetical protein